MALQKNGEIYEMANNRSEIFATKLAFLQWNLDEISKRKQKLGHVKRVNNMIAHMGHISGAIKSTFEKGQTEKTRTLPNVGTLRHIKIVGFSFFKGMIFVCSIFSLKHCIELHWWCNRNYLEQLLWHFACGWVTPMDLQWPIVINVKIFCRSYQE